MNAPIPFHIPHQVLDPPYISAALEGVDFGSRGPSSRAATDLLRTLTGEERILLTNSCTSALELTALTMGVGPGDEVIVPSYAFSSTANAFLRAGASVRFADVDESTLAISPATVEKLITHRTRAIVPVHYAGLPAHIDELAALCNTRGLFLIEDAAQAIGVRHRGRHLGSIGTAGTISFHHTKNIHCGFGGLFIANSRSVDFQRATFIWERGTDRSNLLKGIVDKYTWREVGGSFELGELAAAFLRGQLEALDAVTAHRSRIFDVYAQRLQALIDAGRIRLLMPEPSTDWNYHAVIAVFRDEEDAETVRAALLADGISAYIGYVPLHSSPYGRTLGYRPNDLPVTEAAFPRILRMPIHTGMRTEDAERVCDRTTEALG